MPMLDKIIGSTTRSGLGAHGTKEELVASIQELNRSSPHHDNQYQALPGGLQVEPCLQIAESRRDPKKLEGTLL